MYLVLRTKSQLLPQTRFSHDGLITMLKFTCYVYILIYISNGHKYTSEAFQLIYKFPQCSGKLRSLFYIESRVYDLHHNIKIVISLLLMVQQNWILSISQDIYKKKLSFRRIPFLIKEMFHDINIKENDNRINLLLAIKPFCTIQRIWFIFSSVTLALQ